MVNDILVNISNVKKLFGYSQREIANIFRKGQGQFMYFLSINATTSSRILWGELVRSYASENMWLTAFLIFNFGLFTDYLDGLMAKLFGGKSLFGKYNDKISDFIFMSLSLIGLNLPIKYYFLLGWSWLIVWGSRFVFKKNSKWQKRSMGLSPYFFILVVIVTDLTYAYRAFGQYFGEALVILVIIAISAFVTKKHRLATWNRSL